jgi:VCBS repeat-containing protein
LVHRLGAALTGVALLGALVGPAVTVASDLPPVVPDVHITTAEDTPYTGNLLAGAGDPEEDPLHILSWAQVGAAFGHLDVNAATGAFTFTPAANKNGSTSTWFFGTDGTTSVYATLYISITPVNDPPACPSPVTTTGVEDSQQTGTFHCTDVEGSPLTYALAGGAAHGTALVNGNGSWTYDPIANYSGPDSFTFAASDGTNTSAPATVSVTVTAVNDAPACVDGTTSGAEDTEQSGTLPCYDVDLTDTLTYSQVGTAGHGTAVVESDGSWTYAPDAEWSGGDSFAFRVNDGTGNSNTATMDVTVTAVDDAPVCPASVNTSGAEDGQQSDSVTCTDVDGPFLTYTLVGAADHGTAVVAADGSWTYDPAPDYNGSDTFTLHASDGTRNSGLVTVDVTVTPVNDAPVAAADTVTVVEDTAADVTADILANDTDIDGIDTLTVTGVSDATGGAADLLGGAVTFTPDADACGTGQGGFDYAISDGHGGVSSAHATVDVTCVNDSPVANADTVTVTEDTATDVTASILANDTDIDGDTLFVGGATDPTGGELGYSAITHHVTFTPDADLCGPGAGGFDYVVSDGGLTDSAHVTVDITCVNDNPVASAHLATGTEDTDLVISGATLLGDATDVDAGDILDVTDVSGSTGGLASWDGSDATFVPSPELCGAGAGGFDYAISDGSGGTATAHVTVDLACTEDAPVAVSDTGTAGEGSAAALYDVLANDTDPDAGAVLTLQSADVDPAQGTASVVAGEIRFTPAADFVGDAVISYVVSDGTLTDGGTLTVTVIADDTAPVETVPTVAFGTGRVDETAPLRVSWSAADTGVGVASYEVQVKVAGAGWKAVYTGPNTSITRSYAFGKTLVWRVRATDKASNTSGWVSSATRRLLAYQAPGSSVIKYTGTWTSVAQAASSGTGYRYVTTRSSKASLAFTGSAVLFVAPKTARSGYVKVYVDGHFVGRYSEYRATTLVGQILARASWGASGSHTIRVSSDQSGRHANLDAFIVLR